MATLDGFDALDVPLRSGERHLGRIGEMEKHDNLMLFNLINEKAGGQRYLDKPTEYQIKGYDIWDIEQCKIYSMCE